jgi:hypothetical protein
MGPRCHGRVQGDLEGSEGSCKGPKGLGRVRGVLLGSKGLRGPASIRKVMEGFKRS